MISFCYLDPLHRYVNSKLTFIGPLQTTRAGFVPLERSPYVRHFVHDTIRFHLGVREHCEAEHRARLEIRNGLRHIANA